jgi:hypothetical protein
MARQCTVAIHGWVSHPINADAAGCEVTMLHNALLALKTASSHHTGTTPLAYAPRILFPWYELISQTIPHSTNACIRTKELAQAHIEAVQATGRDPSEVDVCRFANSALNAISYEFWKKPSTHHSTGISTYQPHPHTTTPQTQKDKSWQSELKT